MVTKPHRRELLETYVQDFNELFGEKQNVKRYRRILQLLQCGSQNQNKMRRIFFVGCQYVLTGFDSKYLNTLYVDKI